MRSSAVARLLPLLLPCVPGSAIGPARRPPLQRMSRSDLVDSVNLLPNVMWKAALGPPSGPRLRLSVKDTNLEGDQEYRGVLPGYGRHLRDLAARGEIRVVSSMDFILHQEHEDQQRLEYLRELEEAQVVQRPLHRARGERRETAGHPRMRGSGRAEPGVVFADPSIPLPGRAPDPELLRRLQKGRHEPVTLGSADWAEERLHLPRNFDSAEAWPHCRHVINNILDQGNCGCCWAFCVAEVAQDRLCIATHGRVAVPLSTQNLCFCSTGQGRGCDGGWTTQAWFYLRTMGVVTGQQQHFDKAKYPGTIDPDTFGNGSYCAPYTLPHCHHHGPMRDDPFPAENTLGCPDVPVGQSPKCPRQCDQSAREPHDNMELDTFSFQGDVEQYVDEGAIMAAITRCGPVTATMDAYDDFEHYVSGIYHKTPNATSKGGHAVKITGFGEDPQTGAKYWKVANSWNPHWGENGFVRVRRGVNEIGIEDEVTASSCNAQWTTTSSAF